MQSSNTRWLVPGRGLIAFAVLFTACSFSSERRASPRNWTSLDGGGEAGYVAIDAKGHLRGPDQGEVVSVLQFDRWATWRKPWDLADGGPPVDLNSSTGRHRSPSRRATG